MYINKFKNIIFKIENFCGSYPKNYKRIEVGNDPNFVFENDPNFNAVQLWDAEGNTVFVNSFLECDYYVSGGWDKNPLIFAETNLQLSLLFVSFTVLVFWFLINKRFNI